MGEPAMRLVPPDATAAPAPRPATSTAARAPWREATKPATMPATNDTAGEATKPATDAGGEGATEPDRAAAVTPPAIVVLASHWWRTARADAGRRGGLLWAAVHERPGSLAQLHDYAVSRAWVPDGHEGRFVSGGGALYYHTAGKAAVALGLAWIWVWSRLLHLAVTVAAAGIITILVVACS